MLVSLLAALLASLNPQQQAEAEQDQSAEQVANPGELPSSGGVPTLQTVGSSESQLPCEKRKDEEDCQLEAQWEANQATVENVFWNMWQTIISLLALVGLFGTLLLTRRATNAAVTATQDAEAALKIARKTAQAAQEQVEEARSANERNLRAYLGIESIDAMPTGDGDIAFKIKIRNFGKTPAHSCSFKVASTVANFPSVASQLDGLEFHDQGGELSVHPSGFVFAYGNCTVEDSLREIDAGAKAVYLVGSIAYRDAENKVRRTNFAYRGTESSLLKNMEMHPCFDGNAAT